MARRLFDDAKRVIGLIAAALLTAAVLPAATAGAQSLPSPTLIASAVTSTYSAPCRPAVCPVPAVLVKQGVNFVLTVTLTASGAPAAFNKDTVLTLTAPGPGTLNLTSVTMSRNLSTEQFAVSYSPFANNITVTASVGAKGKPGKIASTPSNAFDVLQTLKTDVASPGDPFADGTGPENCARVDATNPICGYLVLPKGSDTDVLLSSGSCDGLGCNASGVVSQVIADLTGLYSRSAPATLIIKCDRTLCGKGGIHRYTALASQSASGPLSPAPACPAKGTIGADQDFCTDYVQSSRDRTDTLLLYLLFFHDFRGSG